MRPDVTWLPVSTVEVGQDIQRFSCSVNVVAARPTCVWVFRARAQTTDRWNFYFDLINFFLTLVFAISMLLRLLNDALSNRQHYNWVRRCTSIDHATHGCWLIDSYVFVPLWLFCSIFGVPCVIFNFSVHPI